MNFTTEEGGKEYYDMLKRNTAIYMDARQLSNNEDEMTEKEALETLFGDAGLDLNEDY